jgi:hypothetical protein
MAQKKNKTPEKLFVYQRGGTMKYFRNENALITYIGSYSKAKIVIYELKEEYDDAIKYKNAIFSGRERQEQLKVILEDDKVVPTIQKIIERVSEIKWTYKEFFIQKFKNYGKNIETFKNIVGERHMRITLLSIITDVEWYELLLTIHNFRFNILDFKKLDAKTKQKIEENFKTAKENVAKRKKIT